MNDFYEAFLSGANTEHPQVENNMTEGFERRKPKPFNSTIDTNTFNSLPVALQILDEVKKKQDELLKGEEKDVRDK